MRDEYSARELMVAAAARHIRDGDVVFVGMRLPLLAFAVAKATHAPNAVGLFENGLIREEPPHDFVLTMGDGANQLGATSATSLVDVLGLLQGGRVDLGFIGGAQVDRFGNLNTTRVGTTRLPGSGGAADIAAFAKRCVYIMEHEPRRFVERVDYVTSHPRGPVHLVTTLGVFSLGEGAAPRAVSLHPGAERDEVRALTGFEITFSKTSITPPPSKPEIAAIRKYDPGAFWTT
jgi:glutaconate CoA-transferase subunit B